MGHVSSTAMHSRPGPCPSVPVRTRTPCMSLTKKPSPPLSVPRFKPDRIHLCYNYHSMYEKSVRSRILRTYVDTSVFGGVFDEEFARASVHFFQQVEAGRFHLFVSALV